MPAYSITQEGYVKTVARPNRPSQRVSGVLIRVQGNHNAVQSRDNGEFAIVLANLQNGDPYSLSRIFCSGYTLADQELIGKQQVCSEKVALVIRLVNQADLLREQQAITQKAMARAEHEYAERITQLEQQLATHKIKEEEYNQQLSKLLEWYDKFAPVIEALSDTYARTDFDNLDSISTQIHTAIENGDYELAETLLARKGSFELREQEIKTEGQRLAAAQAVLDTEQAVLDEHKLHHNKKKHDLAEDLFRKYSICLAKFEIDEAQEYIERRAAIDTLNIDYQLQAAQFILMFSQDYSKARTYLHRAYDLALTQYDAQSGQMATTCHELARLSLREKQLTKATQYARQALDIKENLTGKNSLETAETSGILGDIYRADGLYKDAVQCFRKAYNIRLEELGRSHPSTIVARNNLAYGYAYQKKYKEAQKLFSENLDICLSRQSSPQTDTSTTEQRRGAKLISDKNQLATSYSNYATVRYMQAQEKSTLKDKLYMLQQAKDAFLKAHELYTTALGEQHFRTLQTKAQLDLCKQAIDRLSAQNTSK